MDNLTSFSLDTFMAELHQMLLSIWGDSRKEKQPVMEEGRREGWREEIMPSSNPLVQAPLIHSSITPFFEYRN
jgi:hypothetical protein